MRKDFSDTLVKCEVRPILLAGVIPVYDDQIAAAVISYK
jgi:hypothetical protein